jgi:hypothetical protein
MNLYKHEYTGLRSALSKGPNRIGISLSSPEDGNRSSFWNIVLYIGARGNVVVEAQCCKPQSQGFDSLWGHWIFSIYLILPAALVPGVYSASNRNEYQK